MTKQTDAELLRGIAAGTVIPSMHDDVLNRVASQLESDAKRYAQSEELQKIGKNCYECIAEMVAALECDYDQLESLRSMRDDKTGSADDGALDEAEAEELAELETAAGDCANREDAEQRIQEDPLSIELSGTWSIGEKPSEGRDLRALILLGTGGPATRIVCELNEHMEPSRAWVQAQDWFTQWTDYVGGDSDTLLTYCRVFYFGEG